MEFVHEVTAYLENKPGRLAKICAALAHEKINIQALAVMEHAERSVLRLVTGDAAETRRVLTSIGTESEEGEVLAMELDNRPGALAKVLEALAEDHVNVEYAYVAAGAAQGKCLGIFHTSNPKKAHKLLTERLTSANGEARGGDRRPLHAR